MRIPSYGNILNFRQFGCVTIYVLLCTSASIVHAQTQSHTAPSANLYGALGLNTVPSARMDKTGDIRINIAESDPYTHASISAQIFDNLNVTLRQSAETSDLKEKGRQYYPGLDLKIRMLEESRSTPEISIGLQSAFGHKRMAGEYIAASKRWKDFDFTGGIGWGRYGTAGHIDNPLKAVSDHFKNDRNFASEIPNEPSDWFTGDRAGLFAGIEYFTPLDGLSVKLDWGADRYSFEQQNGDFNAPAPWGLGLAYTPAGASWMNAQIGTIGGDKIMGRLTFKTNAKDNIFKGPKDKPAPYFRPFRSGDTSPSAAQISARTDGVFLYNTHQDPSDKGHIISGMELDALSSTPLQIGHAARHISNEGGTDGEKITITPSYQGLKGPKIEMLRADFEKAIGFKNASTDEIWQNAKITPQKFMKDSGDIVPAAASRNALGQGYFGLILDHRTSPAEEDFAALSRTSLTTRFLTPQFFGLVLAGADIRFNIHDNLNKMRRNRLPTIAPVRSNIDDFTKDFVTLDRLYTQFNTSLGSDIHMSVSAGYLETQFAGLGGQILYRPYGKRFALGADAWRAVKRDPNTRLHSGYDNFITTTGHINGWYEWPDQDLTLRARAGRYLAGDTGADIAIIKSFDNGASLSAGLTLSNAADLDQYGGTTHINHELRLSFPLGGIKHLPENTRANISLSPFGRDAGQSLDKPYNLYNETTRFSARHIAKNWNKITQ